MHRPPVTRYTRRCSSVIRPRPVAGEIVLQRLRLADPLEGIPQALLNQPRDPAGDRSVVLNPILVVCPGLPGERDGGPVALMAHGRSAISPSTRSAWTTLPASTPAIASRRRSAFRGECSR